MEALIVVIGIVLVIGFGVVGVFRLVVWFLRVLGVDKYPSPKFPCSKCEQMQINDLNNYECKACVDEIRGFTRLCINARGTRDCWKNARKASNNG